MSIISKETWDKFTEEEKDSIKEMYYHYKEYKFNKSDKEQEGAVSAYDCLFGNEQLQPKPLTYEDVVRKIDKNSYISPINGEVYSSKEQLIKENAIHKLLNVAKFLNGDWKPDCKKEEDPKWYICDLPGKRPVPCFTVQYNSCIVYFRTEALASQAVEILGEDTVRLALSTDW